MTSMRLVALLLGAACAGGCATGPAVLQRTFVSRVQPPSTWAGRPRASARCRSTCRRPASVGQTGHEQRPARRRKLRSAARGRAAASKRSRRRPRTIFGSRRSIAGSASSTRPTRCVEPRVAAGAAARPRRTRCWRGSGATGDSRTRARARPIARDVLRSARRRAPQNTLGTLLDALGEPAEARQALRARARARPDGRLGAEQSLLRRVAAGPPRRGACALRGRAAASTRR